MPNPEILTPHWASDCSRTMSPVSTPVVPPYSTLMPTQELEREMMGAAGERHNEMADVAAMKSDEGARSGGGQLGSEQESETGAGQGARDTCSGPQDALLPSAFVLPPHRPRKVRRRIAP